MKFKGKYLIATALTAATLLPVGGMAADNTDPGVIDRKVPSIKIPKSFSPDKKGGKPLQDRPELEGGQGGKVVATITDLRLTGVSAIDTSDLMAVVASYLHRPITELDISKLKHSIAQLYYDRGYILVKVTTPPQNLAKGILEVKVVEARLGNVEVTNDGALNPWLTKKMAARVKVGEVFREQDVESMVSDINNLKNISAKINLRPGKSPGTTDLSLDIKESDEDVHYVSLDNYGSPLTGELVASLHLEKSNLLHMGETFGLDLRRSEDELWSFDVSGKTPTGIQNINLGAHYSHSENEIGDRLAALNASGKTDLFGIELSRNLVNMRNRKSTVSVGLDISTHEAFEDSLGFDRTTSKDDKRQAYFEWSYLKRLASGVMFSSAKIIRGLDIFGANDEGDPLATNINADSDAWIFRPTFFASFLSPFSNGTFKFLGTGQVASGDLLSSDLFVLGGYGSVRGFDPAQETGEAGYQFSIEYNHNLPQFDEHMSLTAGPFIDGGAVFNRRTPAIDDHLYSAGLGVEASLDLVPSGLTTVRLDWAHTLDDYINPQIDDGTFYFRVNQKF